MWLWKLASVGEVKKDSEGADVTDDELNLVSLKRQLATLTSSLYTVTEQKSKMEAVYLSEKRKIKVWNTMIVLLERV